MLDVYELCTPELQEKMISFRSKFKDLEDKKVNQQTKTVSSYCTFLNLNILIFNNYFVLLFIVEMNLL